MKRVLLGLLVVGVLAGCLKSESEQKCNYNECNVIAPAAEIQAVQSYLTNNGITATQHCSGMFYSITQEGTGVKPNFCNAVTINYEGKLTNGTVFDRAPQAPPNDRPATFNLAGVIAGFRIGVPLVKTGGKVTLYIPPSLGYGSLQQGTIPANSILIFNVELLGGQI